MNWSVFLLLLAAALLCMLLELPLVAGLLALAAFFIALGKAGSKAVGTGKKAREALSAGIREDVSKAEGAEADVTVFREGMENAGQLTGQQVYSPDTHKFKYQGSGSIGDACQRLIDSFKRLFK